MTKPKNRASGTLIIVPTYNEEANIQPLVSSIFHHLPSACILFVDDNSPDNTGEEIKKAMESHPDKISLLVRAGKLGLGSAYMEGFAWALKHQFDFIIEMDGDLSHDPRYLPEITAKLESCHFVIGSRNIPQGGIKNWSTLRKLISRFGSAYARFFLKTPFRDMTGGFNGWQASVLDKISRSGISSDGYVFQIELKYRAMLLGFSGVEIPIIFTDRTRGRSKMSWKIVAEAFLRVPLLRLASIFSPQPGAAGQMTGQK